VCVCVCVCLCVFKGGRVSIERMCAGKDQFEVEGADTEKAREEKLLVMPVGLDLRQTYGYLLNRRASLPLDQNRLYVHTYRQTGRKHNAAARPMDHRRHKNTQKPKPIPAVSCKNCL